VVRHGVGRFRQHFHDYYLNTSDEINIGCTYLGGVCATRVDGREEQESAGLGYEVDVAVYWMGCLLQRAFIISILRTDCLYSSSHWFGNKRSRT
jgi:hypothetical protein